MNPRVDAPFSDEQVENLNRIQKFGMFHGFTCGKEHGDPRLLTATRLGWVCQHEGCTYTQTWAHKSMTEFTKDEEDRLRALYTGRGFKV